MAAERVSGILEGMRRRGMIRDVGRNAVKEVVWEEAQAKEWMGYMGCRNQDDANTKHDVSLE